MTRLSDYTTEELERLTTLTFDTMRPGEYVAPRPMVAQLCDVIPPSIRQSVGFKLSSGEIAGFDGSVAPHTTAAQSYAPRRRVTSFTDATELDPPQADMLAELARRKAPVFKVGELVMCGGEISKVVPVPEKFCNDAWANERQIVWMEGDPNSPLGWEYRDKLRPATDAETAAYHRAHCQPKVEPAPVVISNATHAGQWVKWLGRPCKVLSITNLVFTPACGLIAVADEDGCVCHIRPNEAILIDPPTWPQ